MRSHSAPHDASYDDATDPTKVPRLRTQAAVVAAPPLALLVLSRPAVALLTLAALAVLGRVARPLEQVAPRPARPPD